MRKTLVFSFLALLFAAGCPKMPDAEKGFTLDETFEIGVGESAVLKGPSPYEVLFAGVVNDNRCPQGVSCVRAGEVNLRLVLPGGADKVIEFPARPREAVRIALDDEHALQLQAVEPYPSHEGRIDPTEYKIRASFVSGERATY